jgi:L-iditol 2-dehydrogenase
LLEPLVVALAGVERAGVKLGDAVLISGTGPIGLVTLLACHAAGAKCAITSRTEWRLDMAKQLVPSVRTVQVKPGESERDLAKRVEEALGEKPRVALECTGYQSCVRSAIFVSPFDQNTVTSMYNLEIMVENCTF